MSHGESNNTETTSMEHADVVANYSKRITFPSNTHSMLDRPVRWAYDWVCYHWRR